MLYSLVMLRSIFSKPYSHLYIIGDNSGWSIDEDAKTLLRIANDLGISASRIKRARFNLPQIVHYTSQFSLNDESIYKTKRRISVDYYHGKPEQQESFRKCFENLKKHHQNIAKVRVSTKEMETLIKSTGIPENAVVIGSFQKDGVGWGEGNEPKLIKGPDIFLEVVSNLKSEIPNLWVLLSGLSRGYVKNGLDKLGVSYRHQYLKNFRDLPKLYDALDLYIITSREEGGPKACLESMAKGIPLVTTAVGQCKDLVRHGENAMMTPIDDVKNLVSCAKQITKSESLRRGVVLGGLSTAQENNFESQLSLWKQYFSDLVK